MTDPTRNPVPVAANEPAYDAAPGLNRGMVPLVVAVLPTAVRHCKELIGAGQTNQRGLATALRALARQGAAGHRCSELIAGRSMLELRHLIPPVGVYRDESPGNRFVTGGVSA